MLYLSHTWSLSQVLLPGKESFVFIRHEVIRLGSARWTPLWLIQSHLISKCNYICTCAKSLLPCRWCSGTRSGLTLCHPMDCGMPDFPVLHYLQESDRHAQTHVHWVYDVIQPSHPMLPSSPPTFSLSQHQGLFTCVSPLIRGPKYCNFNFSTSPSNEYSGLISFRMDLFDLLAVQGTLKSLLQHHSSKTSILWCSAFFTVQLSHPYMTTGKTIALTRRTFVGK